MKNILEKISNQAYLSLQSRRISYSKTSPLSNHLLSVSLPVSGHITVVKAWRVLECPTTAIFLPSGRLFEASLMRSFYY